MQQRNLSNSLDDDLKKKKNLLHSKIEDVYKNNRKIGDSLHAFLQLVFKEP